MEEDLENSVEVTQAVAEVALSEAGASHRCLVVAGVNVWVSVSVQEVDHVIQVDDSY